MRIDERIVLNIPPGIMKDSLRRRRTWARHAIWRAIWGLRRRIIKEQLEDFLNVFEMSDCVEISIRGELETLKIRDKNDIYKML